MKKILLAMTTLTVMAAASTASADSLGLRGGYYKGFYSANGQSASTDGTGSIGLQYSYSLDALSTLRGAIDLYPNMLGLQKLGFGGEVAYLRKIPTNMSSSVDMNVYVGAGLGVNYVGDSGTSDGLSYSYRFTTVNPTLLAGVNFYATPELGIFGELAGGPSFVFGSATAGGTSQSQNFTGGFIHPRIGLTYTIR